MSAVNVSVKLRKGESQERLLKRFTKICKKSEIVKLHLEKTSYYLTKTQKKRKKRLKNQWLRNKKKNKKNSFRRRYK